MADRTLQLVVQYDGAEFSGWQRQPDARTIQGELERVFSQLNGTPATVTGAGRTDTGVHARGQAAHICLPEKWSPESARRAANSLLPPDIRISACFEMTADFHARYSALTRTYSYFIGTDEDSLSPFRRRYEWYVRKPLDLQKLDLTAEALLGKHEFRGFAVKGTAPDFDKHICEVVQSRWVRDGHKLRFEIEANRFLHHMIRFIVGTMVEIATEKRPLEDFSRLLSASDNLDVSSPAPGHALFLERVKYPERLYKDSAPNTV